MTYYELIEKYKTQELEEAQKKKVEADIERQDAISEYLFDRDEVPIFSDLKSGDFENSGIAEDMDEESEKFTRMIQAAIRKTFIKAGVIVGAVVLFVVCFIIFALPQIIDLFYYDPSEITGVTENGITTNRLSLDLAVYSELFLPGTYREDVEVIGNGNGKYDITVFQEFSRTGTFHNVAGTVNKGKMILYDADLLKKPVSNTFIPAENVVNDFFLGEGMAGEKKYAWDELYHLDDGDYYIAYVTLDKVMGYDDFVTWVKANDIDPNWCIICQKNIQYDEMYDETEYFANENIGFIYSASAGYLSYDREKYPLLTQYSMDETTGKEQDWVVSEDNMKQHMVSMLRYMADAKSFCKMMDMEEDSDDNFNAIADNVEENGLNIYGFTVIAKKDDILKISKLDDVEYICTESYR
ncbi:MAG: anti-sigma factor C-terminal domain-containing protein [Lachnospiraceae bacterium]|nr:anti-sigma factor C-terminal domain-containing protein [Lachnospiraceae bacterium]